MVVTDPDNVHVNNFPTQDTCENRVYTTDIPRLTQIHLKRIFEVVQKNLHSVVLEQYICKYFFYTLTSIARISPNEVFWLPQKMR